MNRLIELLKEKSSEIVVESMEVLKQSDLEHYDAEGIEEFCDLALQCLAEKKMIKMTDYVKNTANERLSNDHYIFEIHTTINILEEIIRQKIIKDMQISEYVGAISLISTLLGSVKDVLIHSYISLAKKSKILADHFPGH